MQHRMKEFQMDKESVDKVLTENRVGHVAAIGTDGFSYVAPVFFCTGAVKYIFTV